MASLFFFLGLALLVSIIGAVYDHRTGHIPNWLTLGALALALVLHVATGALGNGLTGAGAGAITSVSGILLCSIVPLILYRMAGMGGGDLKLLAAIGAFLGPLIGLQAQMYSFVAILLYAPAKMAYEGKLLRTLLNTLSLIVNPFLPKAKRKTIAPELMTSLRFGPSVAAGVLATALAHWSVG
jgi:prepilin peptidase CpaA